ncbi:TonB-dependent receptor [Fibrisoma montanum]|uniref:TonB-dependent receptor n=1 Tax=Fibrisoma montanum TaxID=2305895 RepID=A0A418MDR1_9BACT|nr:TonB-dependent receptor [Fibrisoma montanum]RIV24863.1 TonB-dependent receptor [Fibrisoma montanum]
MTQRLFTPLFSTTLPFTMLRYLLLLLLPTSFAAAQSYSITGSVAGADQKAVEGAVVSLLRSTDSSFVKGALVDANGTFAIAKLSAGTFRLSVSYLGYQNYMSQPITLDEQHAGVTLPAIALQPAEKSLSEVRVVAKKPFVEQRIDRVVVNPDALISNAGTTSLEVLEKAPGVQVDANGVISLQGRAGVVVFVDDKPTYLSAGELANYLRSLPSGSIETIEIMTNPPAKYDAAGNAGVINIRLKKTKARGLNGGWSVSYGQGRYFRSNNSANLNYRTGNLNFFGNVSLNANNMYQDLTIWREYFAPTGQKQSGFTQNSYIRRRMNSANLKAGVDWYVSGKSTLGLVLSGFHNPATSTVTNNARLFDANGGVTARVEAFTPSDRLLDNKSANLNYAYKFDSSGRELSINLDYLTYGSDTDQSLTNTVFATGQPVEKTVLESSLPSTINIRTAKADYVHPLAKGSKVEAGVKRSDIETDNVANFFDVVGNERRPNYEFSNNFTYNEAISAGYLNYSLERKRFTMQAGLRFEHTAIRGEQLGNEMVNDSSFSRQYNSLFPTFYATYRLDSAGKHQLRFSYGRRIDRPNYQSMNPFTYPLDRFTLYGGNPYLRPTFSDNLELSHTFNNSVTTTLRYSQARDVIFETIQQGNQVFYSRPGNIGKQVSYGIALNGTWQPVKWWTLQVYSEVMYNRFQANLYNQQLDNSGTYWYVAPTNQFRLTSSWSAELAGTYQTRAYVGQFIIIPIGQVRAGIAKTVWKNKGTLKLAVSDLFYTNQVGGDIQGLGNSTARWYSYLDSRVATISFAYRFNSGQTLRQRQTGGSESEQSRVRS